MSYKPAVSKQRLKELTNNFAGTCCFWCGRRGEVTKDHVVPLAANGFDIQTNIVDACVQCNGERGVIVNYLGWIKKHKQLVILWRSLPHWYKVRIRNTYFTMLKKQDEITSLQLKWKGIEEAKYGFSPSFNIDLTVPFCPR